MTLCFAAILSAVVEERVDARAGAMLLRSLLAIGIFSPLLWRWTDDLRLYAWAQFFPFVVLVLYSNSFRRNLPALTAATIAYDELSSVASFSSYLTCINSIPMQREQFSASVPRRVFARRCLTGEVYNR